MKQVKERLKDPVILALIVGLIYQALKYFGISIDEGFFDQVVDVITLLLLGITIVKVVPPTKNKKKPSSDSSIDKETF